MTTFSEPIPATLPSANRTGCGGRLVELLILAWVAGVSFVCQVMGWGAAALGAETTPLDAVLLQALLEATWADPALNTADGLLAALPAIDAGLEDGP